MQRSFGVKPSSAEVKCRSGGGLGDSLTTGASIASPAGATRTRTLLRAETKKEIRHFTPVRAFYTSKIYTFHWHFVRLGIISTVLLGSSIDSGVIFKKEIKLFTPVRAFYTSKIYTFHWHFVRLGIINTVLLGSSIDSGVTFKKESRLFTPV